MSHMKSDLSAVKGLACSIRNGTACRAKSVYLFDDSLFAAPVPFFGIYLFYGSNNPFGVVRVTKSSSGDLEQGGATSSGLDYPIMQYASKGTKLPIASLVAVTTVARENSESCCRCSVRRERPKVRPIYGGAPCRPCRVLSRNGRRPR